MRNYWIRIAVGAFVIFAVGMVGITLVRRGMGGVQAVAEGTSPIRIPLAFVSFKLDGQKLGTLSHVVLHRDAPKRLSSVEIEVKLTDSVLARGLEGCRLVANFDADQSPRGADLPGPLSSGVFSCLQEGDTTSRFQEFGRAILQPGNVSVPLLLPNDMVDDLKEGHFSSSGEDSIGELAQATADSIADAADAMADSIATAAEQKAESIVVQSERLVDSLRREGMRRADSTRQAVSRIADPGRRR